MKVRTLFVFFFISGFCGLVHEVVWLRLSMASFGVTTPLVSFVLSVFMAGLALGSWSGGRLARRLESRPARSALMLYALAEAIIGVSALVVPPALRWGRETLAGGGGGIAWGSAAHHVAAGAWVGAVLIPFCAAMGATFPIAIAYVRGIEGSDRSRAFSFLYLPNVLGAAAGALAPAVCLVELFGFQGTLRLAAAMNLVLAVGALLLARAGRASADAHASSSGADHSAATGAPVSGAGAPSPGSGSSAGAVPAYESAPGPTLGRVALVLLFMTGLVSMGLEVVWVRQLTPFLGTVVYAFATILTVYLLSTYAGSAAYRRWSRSARGDERGLRAAFVWFAVGLFSLLSLLSADPRAGFEGGLLLAFGRVLLGVGPFCATVGFLTPLLVDRWSSGVPDRAGAAYAVNVIGCILGPLLAGFLLLPALGERGSLVALSLAPFAAGALAVLGGAASRAVPGRGATLWGGAIAGAAAVSIALVLFTRDFETIFQRREVRRDSTATVIATGRDMGRQLLVNGQGMTVLTSVSKMMAHLPLAFRARPPRSALVICFGMGTSFRSAASWEIPTTAVELIPSVPSMFGYFHADAGEVLSRPGARIVVDDGRRFLERTTDSYDVITVDPPPPVEAAGSSLLYSREFYTAVRRRLAPGGILQQWFPGGEPTVASAVARSLKDAFPHVRSFQSHEGWGFHFLASDAPIPPIPADVLARRLPPRAAADIIEWDPAETAERYFSAVLRNEVGIDAVVGLDPGARSLTDDWPVNEYYLLRRVRQIYTGATRPPP